MLLWPGTTTIEFALEVGLADFDARRTTIDDDADTAAVRFAPGRDAKKLAEGVSHGASSLPIEQGFTKPVIPKRADAEGSRKRSTAFAEESRTETGRSSHRESVKLRLRDPSPSSQAQDDSLKTW